jgi:N-acetylglucosaminyldiphosphoundecaprenol N-acetyl-beta-D-mannosaminyltransferase
LVDTCSFAEACNAVMDRLINGGPPAYVLTPNAQHIVLLEDDSQLREVYSQADLVVPDGASLLAAARLLGQRFPERVAGVDLFQSLCELAAVNGLRVFLLGGRPGSADLAAANLARRFPGLSVNTYCPPLGFESDAAEKQGIFNALTDVRPDLLFVALGAPKQEFWIHQNTFSLGIPVSLGVGGSFEMVAGITPRAPVWLRKVGGEWLHRLFLEPRRMWRRYSAGNLHFARIVLKQWLREARVI